MDSLAVTQEVFQRFGNHDVDGIYELLDSDATIDFYGPSVIPYAGHYRGASECRRFFETVLSSVNIHVFQPDKFITEGNWVAVLGHLHLTTKRDGREITSDFAHIIECRDGKWLHFRDFMNTVVAQEAFASND